MTRLFYPGRFEPFHNGHLAVLRNIIDTTDCNITVYISEKEPNLTAEDYKSLGAVRNRSDLERFEFKWAFSTELRKKLIVTSLRNHGLTGIDVVSGKMSDLVDKEEKLIVGPDVIIRDSMVGVRMYEMPDSCRGSFLRKLIRDYLLTGCPCGIMNAIMALVPWPKSLFGEVAGEYMALISWVLAKRKE